MSNELVMLGQKPMTECRALFCPEIRVDKTLFCWRHNELLTDKDKEMIDMSWIRSVQDKDDSMFVVATLTACMKILSWEVANLYIDGIAKDGVNTPYEFRWFACERLRKITASKLGEWSRYEETAMISRNLKGLTL